MRLPLAACLVSIVFAGACVAPDAPAADTAVDTDTDDTSADTDTDTDTDDTDTDDTAGTELSWVDDVFQPYLEESCAGCHQDPGYIHPPISTDLSHLVNAGSGADGMPYITPGSLEESFLWYKITDRQDEVVGGGERMPPPPDNEPLSADAIAAVEAWILSGAAL